MDNTLRTTLTQTHRGDPLAVVDGLPGGSAELTPAQLRALAQALTKIAADCEARPRRRGVLLTVRREYVVSAALAP